MSKRILDVGNCGPDHYSIRTMIDQHFEAEVVQVHSSEEAMSELTSGKFDLVLVNRVFDQNGFEGLELIRELKTSDIDPPPVMLITNFLEHQDRAIEIGAAPGFGKSEIGNPDTIEKLAAFLA